jgi:hypothetical protein
MTETFPAQEPNYVVLSVLAGRGRASSNGLYTEEPGHFSPCTLILAAEGVYYVYSKVDYEGN